MRRQAREGSFPTWSPISCSQHHYQPSPSCPFSQVSSLLILQVLCGLDISLHSLGRSPRSHHLCPWAAASCVSVTDSLPPGGWEVPTAHPGPRQHRWRHLGPTGYDAMILLILVAAWSDVCLVSVDCGPARGANLCLGAPPQLAQGLGWGSLQIPLFLVPDALGGFRVRVSYPGPAP